MNPQQPPKDLSGFVASADGAANESLKHRIERTEPIRSFPSSMSYSPSPPREEIQTVQWPDPPAEAAYYGLAGEVVRMIAPHTEADSVALLVQLLFGFGNIIKRGPHFIVESDKHFTNEYAVLVGVSSKARKGSSWGRIRQLLLAADASWEKRIQSGLTSGEGLTWAVRDRIEKNEPVRKQGKIDGYQHVCADEGVEDKRLLALEPEFASILRVIAREGNTLSTQIRQAWDTGTLCTITKNNPAVATGAHISIIGHITRDELLRTLSRTEEANGFANRFLWICVKRSKSLPLGGKLHEVNFSHIVQRLVDAIADSITVGEMDFEPDARALWFAKYDELSEGRPGLLGAVTSRAEAHVLRLSCLYALLDQSSIIRVEHLNAALALWRYAEDSARFIFGDSLGDPVADELLKTLRSRPDGMNRTDMRDHFGRNRKSEEIGRALQALAEQGLAYRRSGGADAEPGRGRPEERWFATGPTQRPPDTVGSKTPSPARITASVQRRDGPEKSSASTTKTTLTTESPAPSGPSDHRKTTETTNTTEVRLTTEAQPNSIVNVVSVVGSGNPPDSPPATQTSPPDLSVPTIQDPHDGDLPVAHDLKDQDKSVEGEP